LLVAMLLTLFSVDPAAAQMVASKHPALSSNERNLVVEISKEAVRAEAEARISGDFGIFLSWPHSESYKELLMTREKELSGSSAASRADDEQYSSYSATFDVKRVEATQSGAAIRLLEQGVLRFKNPNGEPGMPTTHEYEYEHELRLRRDKNGWTVTEDKVLNLPKPVAPLGTPQPIPDADLTLPIFAGISAIQEEQIATGNATVNRSAVASYATTYWSSYNRSYRSFSPTDCTNFVSQAVRAGGWPDVPGWYRSTPYWWYNALNQTWTWVNAHYWALFTYNRPRGSIARYVSDLRVGDVLEADWDADGNIDHAMVVTAKTGTEVYLTYHSNNTKNKPFRELLASQPRAKWYGFLLASSVN
jgi:hypothetical protein